MKTTLKAILCLSLFPIINLQSMEQPNTSSLQQVFEQKFGAGKDTFYGSTKNVPTTFGFNNKKTRIKCSDTHIICVEPALAKKSLIINTMLKKQFSNHLDSTLSFVNPHTQKDIYDNPAIDLSSNALSSLFACIHQPKELTKLDPKKARTLLHTAEYLMVKPSLMNKLSSHYCQMVENIKEDPCTHDLVLRYSKQIEQLLKDGTINANNIISNCENFPLGQRGNFRRWTISLKSHEKGILLANNQLRNLYDIEKVKAIVDLNDIVFLDLRNNKLTRINVHQLRAIFPNLKYINLENNSIRTLRKLDYKNLPQNFSIILRNNKIEKIEKDTFHNIPNAIIDLSHNKLDALTIEEVKNALKPRLYERTCKYVKKTIVDKDDYICTVGNISLGLAAATSGIYLLVATAKIPKQALNSFNKIHNAALLSNAFSYVLLGTSLILKTAVNKFDSETEPTPIQLIIDHQKNIINKH